MKLSLRTKLAVLLIVFVIAFYAGSTPPLVGFAWGKIAIQDPPPDGIETPLRLNVILPSGNQAVQKRIQEELRNPGQIGETGNPVLDGVLDTIRQQGSRVQQAIPEIPSLRGDSDLIEPPSLELRADLVAQMPDDQIPTEQSCLLAEQLLKTARMLSKESDSPARRELIESLRREAARCLNQRR